MRIPGILVLLSTLSLFSPPRSIAAEPSEIAEQIRALSLDSGSGIRITGAEIVSGPATLRFHEGVAFLTHPVAGYFYELVFIGKGRIELDPADRVEAEQLELFTGSRRLAEEFDAAVLVIADGSTRQRLIDGKAREAAEPAAISTASDLYAKWKLSAERRLLEVENAIFGNAVGDAILNRYFAAFVRGSDLGEFVYLVDPEDQEQVTLGQFVPLEATEREKRKLQRKILREQRRGRQLGQRIEDLGNWDNWVSATLRDTSGRPVPGSAGFEPESYTIDLSIADSLRLSGKAKIQLRADFPERRVATLRLIPDLAVTAASLPFFRSTSAITVVLPAPTRRGQSLTVEVEYAGNLLEKERKFIALPSPVGWYPHVGAVDRAKYDVSFRWPRQFELIASGRRVDGGEQQGRRWERRVIDVPVIGFSFELGKFDVENITAGHVAITFAVDPAAVDLSRAIRSIQRDRLRSSNVPDAPPAGLSKEAIEEIKTHVRDSLLFLEQTWGPYPLDHLTVVTVSREEFSQSLAGFMTLSTAMMADQPTDLFSAFRASMDRRAVIAHEVAHQWWGHVVGWKTYRDQWLSEALSNYSALLYSRRKLDWKGRYQIGMTSFWQDFLSRSTADGRPLESLGPLVAGARLFSSRSSEAYGPIVYQKGAIVLDMLARSLGEDRFEAILRSLIQKNASGRISTEDFLAYVAVASGRDVSAFAEQFIYGTGIPEVYYEFSTAKKGSEWSVNVTARQTPAYRYRYHIVKSGRHLDVQRQRVGETAVSEVTMVVPIQVVINPGNEKKGEPRTYARNTVQIRGDYTPITINIPWEPKDVWLDKEREVLAYFFSEQRNSKRYHLNRAQVLAAEGKQREAEEALKRALSAAPSRQLEWELGFEVEPYVRNRLIELENQFRDAYAWLELARLYLDSERDSDAQSAMSKARGALRRDLQGTLEAELLLLEARLDVRRGEFRRAYDRLRKPLLGKRTIDSGEGYALLAIAAERSGQREDFAKALDKARDRGVDVSMLR